MRIIEIAINANIFPVNYLKNRVIINFNFEVCPPLDPASHLHMLCQYTMLVYSIKDLLGQGGKHTLVLKMVMTLFFFFFDSV